MLSESHSLSGRQADLKLKDLRALIKRTSHLDDETSLRVDTSVNAGSKAISIAIIAEHSDVDVQSAAEEVKEWVTDG